jgi:hypothetical protein
VACPERRRPKPPLFGSTGLLDPLAPFDQRADLKRRVAFLRHPLDEICCFFSVRLSFLALKEITGRRSSTCVNILRSITSQSFSYEVQDNELPPLRAHAHRTMFTTSLRKFFGFEIPAAFSIFSSLALSTASAKENAERGLG